MKKQIKTVCSACGITANYLTCLKKYGKPPLKPCFDVSTLSNGKCDYCGHKRPVTQTRDYFFPDFELLEKFKNYMPNTTIKTGEEQNRIKAEASIFWNEIARNLPKSIERSALGDENIYNAFFAGYIKFRPHFIKQSCLKTLQEIEDKLPPIKIESKEERHRNSNLVFAGFNSCRDEIKSIINQMK